MVTGSTIKREPCCEQKRGGTMGTITKEYKFEKIYQEIERNECEGKKEKKNNQKENK